jgi:hypothetical protein
MRRRLGPPSAKTGASPACVSPDWRQDGRLLSPAHLTARFWLLRSLGATDNSLRCATNTDFRAAL